ncbi:MAG: acyltransferase family protein [Acetatifactor sp.]|nr:acyltransferase family protein [Acetatifactor sp.]
MSKTGQGTDIKIKERDSYYCNLKLLLIFCVVYGHTIEALIDSSAAAAQLYRIIYAVHMPLFLFLSGLFLKDGTSCLRQMKQMLLYYSTIQAVTVLVGRKGGLPLSLGTPVWHLWYLLSLGCMAALGWCWYELAGRLIWLNRGIVKIVLIAVSILGACVVGEYSEVGRWLSLSRTICFLPYFLTGLFCPSEISWEMRRFRMLGLAGLMCFLSIYLNWGCHMPVELFYQADSYEVVGVHEIGAFLRFLYLCMGCALGAFLLAFTPRRRFLFSKAGTNTLWIYLLHPPLVKLFGYLRISEQVGLSISPLIAVFIILFLYKLFQWRHPMYALPTADKRVGKKGNNNCIM